VTAASDATTVGLMRNLGRFFGHLAAGARSSPTGTERREVRRTVEETAQADGVVLRRTVIEEVEVPARRQAADLPNES